MIPSTVKQLSRIRSRGFKSRPDYDEETWKKAQKLQDTLYKAGDEIYVFLSYKFFKLGLKKITKSIVENHIKAFSSKLFSEFENKRILYVYDEKIQVCECKNFWLLGYCKHFLAIKIYKKEIEVHFIQFIILTN